MNPAQKAFIRFIHIGKETIHSIGIRLYPTDERAKEIGYRTGSATVIPIIVIKEINHFLDLVYQHPDVFLEVTAIRKLILYNPYLAPDFINMKNVFAFSSKAFKEGKSPCNSSWPLRSQFLTV